MWKGNRKALRDQEKKVKVIKFMVVKEKLVCDFLKRDAS